LCCRYPQHKEELLACQSPSPSTTWRPLAEVKIAYVTSGREFLTDSLSGTDCPTNEILSAFNFTSGRAFLEISAFRSLLISPTLPYPSSLSFVTRHSFSTLFVKWEALVSL
jgi:hypothetical protein